MHISFVTVMRCCSKSTSCNEKTAIFIATFFFEKVTLTTVILAQKPLRNYGYYDYDYFTIMKS